MKKLIVFILVPLISIVLIVFWWKANIQPVSSDSSIKRLVIAKGTSAIQIGEQLNDNEIIRSPLAFKFYVQLTGKSKRIQAGEFNLSSDLNLFEVVNQLLSGPSEVWITVPEGLRHEEVIERFILGLEKQGEEQVLFRNSLLSLTKGSEGELFPDTYLFPKTASASAVYNMLVSTFNKKLATIIEDDIQDSTRSMSEVLVMASLLERETVTSEERPIVAGILYKRLDNEWPLQVDAAVQYAVASAECGSSPGNCDNWWPILTRADLDINSSFNTYKYPGLPPTPIANPGTSSIDAAIYPEDSPYWFYIHDEKGKIHYAETVEEHNRNIAKYL